MSLASYKTLSDPRDDYLDMYDTWMKNKAICKGDRYAKKRKDLLIKFSSSMTPEQYDLLVSESELPGISNQFCKTLVGLILKRQPIISLPDGVPEEIKDWLLARFGIDDSPLLSFLNKALFEEIQTGRAWIFVDFPKNGDELEDPRPYPILYNADNIINWHMRNEGGRKFLDKVIVRGYVEHFRSGNEFHPDFIDTIYVHDIDETGHYRLRTYESPVIDSQANEQPTMYSKTFELIDVNENIKIAGERMTYIPAWPLNGEIELTDCLIQPIIDKEIALYNKVTRRNHLLLGAATYTPVIKSNNVSDEDFRKIVNSGLGSWLRIGEADSIEVLETPTAALQDMDRAIAAGIDEISRLGVRILAPETNQSGVALEIRNATQAAQLGTLSSKVSNTMKQVITCMINWMGYDITEKDVGFDLNNELNTGPTGVDCMRLVSEWYQAGLIPRSIFLDILKRNELVDAEYDDEEGQMEINEDDLLMPEIPKTVPKETPSLLQEDISDISKTVKSKNTNTTNKVKNTDTDVSKEAIKKALKG